MQCVVPEAKLVSLCNQGRDSLRVHLLHAQFTNGPASYNIIHFGGHCRDGCLVFGGPADPEALSLDVFAELVLAYCPDVKAVLLNGCGGTQQEAERALHALLEAEIPVVVAVGRLKDQCAQRFARGFFDAIFIGKNADRRVDA
ncbi:hypothetical protein WJX72_007886 [[Myrmecia] bisecta]|uniref:CHAT domain-containing protein n=1 Tax=[Myrmecia] bisecta TaxID=41462 RepID=A0AAW1Q1I0_9CHLO